MVLVTDVDNRDKIAVYAILSLLSCIFQNLCIPVFSGLHSIYLCLSHKAKEAQTSLSRATFPSSSRGGPQEIPKSYSPLGPPPHSLRRRPRGILIRYLNQPNWFVQCGGDKMNDQTPSSYLAELSHPAEEACFCCL